MLAYKSKDYEKLFTEDEQWNAFRRLRDQMSKS